MALGAPGPDAPPHLPFALTTNGRETASLGTTGVSSEAFQLFSPVPSLGQAP